MLSHHNTIHYLCAHVRSLTYCHLSSFFFKNCPITQFARKIKTVVQVVFGLFPLFDNSDSSESTEPSDSIFRQFAQFAVSDSTDSTFQNSCVSRLFDTDRCNFVRGNLPYFLPCAEHMKIRESSTLKFKTKKFSAKHHNNFSEALTFSSGRFQSISHAKRGVRCPKGIETRLNFRRKSA